MFKDFIQNHQLIDLETSNGTFTWNNPHGGPKQVACRLDRFLICESLMLYGMHMESSILPVVGSDHWLTCLSLEILSKPLKKPFRFKKFWLPHSDSLNNVQIWWEEVRINHCSLMYHFQQHLKGFKQRIKLWKKMVLGDIFQAQKLLSNRLGQLHNKSSPQATLLSLPSRKIFS